MRGRSGIGTRALALACIVCCGCAITHAPWGWMGYPAEERAAAHGAWVALRLDSPSAAQLRGELIAVSEDSLFMADRTFHAVARSTIRSARLLTYNPGTLLMAGGVMLGTGSTILNGWALIFTAPMWMIGGAIATGMRTFEPILDYPACGWSRLAPFARFPQGLPMMLDRSSIHMKSYNLGSPGLEGSATESP